MCGANSYFPICLQIVHVVQHKIVLVMCVRRHFPFRFIVRTKRKGNKFKWQIEIGSTHKIV